MKIKLILSCLIAGNLAIGQTTTPSTADNFSGKISLSVTAPENPDGLTPSQISKLQTRSLSIATRNGIGGVGYSTGFVMTPKIDIYDEAVMEGMRNMTVVTTEYTLVIKQANNGLAFATYTASIKGTGFNKAEALNNAISQINPGDLKAKEFIEEGKKKILDFYNSKCQDILAEADKYNGMNNYQRALAILLSVPVEATPCQDKIRAKAISTFKLYQKKECQTQIQIAKAQIAAKQYQAALTSLTFVDPTSACFSEANKLIASAESKLTAEDKRLWDMEREKMKNKIEMEKYQIDAMKGVANSFLGIFGGGSGGSSGGGGGSSILGTIMNFLF